MHGCVQEGKAAGTVGTVVAAEASRMAFLARAMALPTRENSPENATSADLTLDLLFYERAILLKCFWFFCGTRALCHGAAL